jgi:hypothetical protein
MKLYVAGPMTGIPKFNFPAFDEMAVALREDGHDVVSPAELDDPVDRAAALASPDGSALSYGNGVKKSWGEFLARDVKLLADGGIEGVVVLPGWERSRGARLETFVANQMAGLQIFQPDHQHNNIDIIHIVDLRPVTLLTLVRAWAAKPDISFATPVPA